MSEDVFSLDFTGLSPFQVISLSISLLVIPHIHRHSSSHYLSLITETTTTRDPRCPIPRASKSKRELEEISIRNGEMALLDYLSFYREGRVE
jgi:hypothetical protein